MKCEVCGAELTHGSSACGFCGYPVLVEIGNTPESRQKKEEAAAAYRAQICKDIEVGFYAYTHKIVEDADGNEKLKRDRTDKVKIALCGDVSVGGIVWCQEGFLRPQTDVMDCRIYIKRGSQIRGPKLLNVPVPDGTGDIRIGMEKVSDCLIRICIGEEKTQSYTSSEPINVLTE
ncbi:MAG: hypothetical protein IJI10_09545 [Eubacterium sp.]|nr:hypothetical protein [Eubacterium sp.]